MIEIKLTPSQEAEVTHISLCHWWEAVYQNTTEDMDKRMKRDNLNLMDSIEEVVYGIWGFDVLNKIKERNGVEIKEDD